MLDEELVRQIKNGNLDCANVLIERHYTAILRYCSRHCFNMFAAEDLTQETFFRVFRDFSKYDDCGKFRAYLYKIAYHLCVDESKKPVCYPLNDDIEASDEAFDQIENKDAVNQLLKRLSPVQREIILLRFGEQLTFREISEITGSPIRTIQSRIRLAIIAMKKEKL